jgi:TonB-linked SusC/RagA family outer membrane protein
MLTVGENLNLTFVNNTGISVGNQYNSTLRSAFGISPIVPVYSDNNIYDSPFNDTSDSDWNKGDGNPYASMMMRNSLNRSQKLFGNIYAVLRPIAGLQIRTNFGLDHNSYDNRSYTPIYQFGIYSRNTTTRVNQGAGNGNTFTWTNTAQYDFNVADDHAIGVMLGMEAIQNRGINVSGENVNLLSQFNDWDHAYLNNTTGTEANDEIRARGNPSDIEKRSSYFGRVTYNYKEKYLFNATLRRDGSSRYARGHRWGTFPSFSAGWVASNEPFMESLVASRALDYLKVRASWGQVGNQNAPNFQYAAPISTSTGDPYANDVFGTGKVNVAGAFPTRLANPEFGWETSQQINAGFDARFLGGRLDMSFDWYQKTTIDWMVRAPVVATAGADAPWINGGDVRNSGVELALNWNDRVGEFIYRIGINGSYNKNNVRDIPTADKTIHGVTNQLYDNAEEAWRVQNGHAMGYFWGYETAGIFQNQAQIDAHRASGKGFLQPNPVPGDAIFVDQDGNGIVDPSDKIDLGNGIPKFNMGFNVELSWKGVDFAVSGYGMFGNKILQSYRNSGRMSNYTKAVLGRWTGEGTSNRIPRVTETNNNIQFSDLYLQKGDFLRISTVTLGYDFSRLVNVNWMSRLRVYGQVQNALTFTKYDGMDPEIGFGPEPFVTSVDIGYYPRPRIVMFGAQLTF